MKQLLAALSFRPRILPMLALIAAVSFGVRFGDIIKQTASPQSAIAQEADNAPDIDDMIQDRMDGVTSNDAMPDDMQDAQSVMTEATSDDEVGEVALEPWRDSADTDFEYSDVQMELFDDLAQRRKDLDKRDKSLNMREALMQAAQKEMEQKFKELTSLRAEIEELLVEQSEEETQRIASLVKIYEGMKAKDAARIFNTLDLDVLMQVVTKMSERKSAPIIAAMDAERARTVTVMLAEQKQLPDITEDFFN